MTLSAFPAPRPQRLFASAGPLRDWLAPVRAYFPSGTEALYWAYRGLGAGPGTTVWLPSYNCGVEVQAALDCGAQVEFYRTNLDLSHDLDHLEPRLRAKPGPVVAIHYFGFPQPEIPRLAALCRELRIPWIADCAHAMFTRAPGEGSTPWLFAQAPVSIFSLHKFIGLYDGGALLHDAQKLHAYTDQVFIDPPPGRFHGSPYRHMLKDIARRLVGELFTSLYRNARFRKNGASAAAPQPTHLSPLRYGRRMSTPSRRLLFAEQSADTIIAARRANYEQLSAALAGVPGFKPVFPALPAGVCPLGLPIWTEQRAALLQALNRAGIEPFIFGEHAYPTINPADFPNMATLRDNILCLPIHQHLHPDQITKLSAVLRAALR